jgi:hypothetical protein
MPARTEIVPIAPFEPTCKECPDGADLAITVFFPGTGDDTNDAKEFIYTGDAGRDLESFVAALSERIGRSSRCCVQVLLRVHLDATRTAEENADDVARQVNTLAASFAAGSPWLRRIYFHLIGFSAGGIVALHCARKLSCRFTGAFNTFVPAPARTWCGRPLAPPGDLRIPASIDVLTIATPFMNFGAGFENLRLVSLALRIYRALSGVLPFIDGTLVFDISIGLNDYGGPPPVCLCRNDAPTPERRGLISFVTSSDYDDTSGADKDPTDDPRLRGWEPVARRLVKGPSERLTHIRSPSKALAEFPNVLVPGCRCQELA